MSESVQVGWWHLEMNGKKVRCNHYGVEAGDPCGRRDQGTWYPVWRSVDGGTPWTEAPDPAFRECFGRVTDPAEGGA